MICSEEITNVCIEICVFTFLHQNQQKKKKGKIIIKRSGLQTIIYILKLLNSSNRYKDLNSISAVFESRASLMSCSLTCCKYLWSCISVAFVLRQQRELKEAHPILDNRTEPRYINVNSITINQHVIVMHHVHRLNKYFRNIYVASKSGVKVMYSDFVSQKFDFNGQ